MRSTSAVEHPRGTEKPPGTPSGRRLRLGTRKSPVERLFPPSGGVSRGSVRVGVVKTFLLPSYGFSFGYKRKGVSIAPLTSTQRDIVGHKICASFTSVLVYAVMQTAISRSLSLSQALLILKGLTALPPRRSPLVLRLFALALADGSGLPFSLYPPPAALESQTPQREPRRLRRRAQIFPLRSVKFGFDFTVCLYSLHSPAIIMGYYISTLHFHIFLLFSISFL